jgi:hypothetical protein
VQLTVNGRLKERGANQTNKKRYKFKPKGGKNKTKEKKLSLVLFSVGNVRTIGGIFL